MHNWWQNHFGEKEKEPTKAKDIHHDYNALGDLHTTMATLLSDRNYVRDEYPKNAAEAWTRLLAGNKRFATGDLTEYLLHLAHEVDPDRRKDLSKSQNPFVVILTCSDSRVAPELIFDQGLGDLFVVRTAGNIPDNVAMGSLEYGILHLKAPLLLVLGHEKCGAVTATLNHLATKKANKIPENHEKTHIDDIVAGITPAAQIAYDKFTGDEAVHHAVKENVLYVGKHLSEYSKGLKGVLEAGTLKIITAVYDLDTGYVTEVK